jgi:peptidylprolyl isomerase
MTRFRRFDGLAARFAGAAALLALAGAGAPAAAAPPAAPGRTLAEILAASLPSDWRPLDPENTLYLELATGRVVIELAPAFAPQHAANVKALAREGYFDGLEIVRSQDNYVVQWGDADGKREIKNAKRQLPGEFTRSLGGELAFARLSDGDVYAPEVGFSGGFPAARDANAGRAWLVHCYGMLGAGRGNDADSGGGAELYVVIGHAPRHLDRNVTLLGRVVKGMELLSSLPRGRGPLGFYEKAEERVPVRSLRVAADLPEKERTNLEVIRTDTETFAALIESRRNRREEWFKQPSGRVELCNVPIVARPRPVVPEQAR